MEVARVKNGSHGAGSASMWVFIYSNFLVPEKLKVLLLDLITLLGYLGSELEQMEKLQELTIKVGRFDIWSFFFSRKIIRTR